MYVSLGTALGSRVLPKGGQQDEVGTKAIRIPPFSNRFHRTPCPLPIKPYKEKDISQRDLDALGGGTSEVGCVDSGAWALRVFGLFRTGMVDWKIRFHPFTLLHPLQGMVWAASRSSVPEKPCLSMTEMVLNISIETIGFSVGDHCMPKARCPTPSQGHTQECPGSVHCALCGLCLPGVMAL